MSLWRPKRLRAIPQPDLPGMIFAQQRHASVRRLSTPEEHALEVARVRMAFTSIMFVIAYLIIAGRIASLTLFSEPPDIVSAAITSSTNNSTKRADITDRNGTVLATSLPTVSLCANAKKMLDPDDAEKKLLTELPELNKDRLNTDLHSSKSCASIRRHLTPKQYYAINKLGIAGLEFSPDERRIYPAGNLVSHAIGYTDVDNLGLAGIEKSLDARLQQEPSAITTSIDLRLQMLLHRELSSTVTEFRAEGGTGIIMDISNGEILSMVSLPDFDPHRPSDSKDEEKFNSSALGVYEMGSTFKIFNTAMALDSGLIRPADTFDTTRPIEVGHQTIKDFHAEDHKLNVAEIFTKSSNIGSALMAERMGGARQRAFLSKLGLTEKVSLEIPEVGAPLVPSASNWGDTTTMTVSFGHGIAVNAVQMAAAVASIMNDGIRIYPTLLHTKHPSTVPTRVISSRTSQQMKALFRLVVTNGTAKQAEVPGYMVGGKTGTADKLSGKKYSENARRASFIGVFPINAPRYLVLAILDDPKATSKTHGYATAGWNVAPMVGRIIGQMGPMMGVSPVESDVVASTEQQLFKQLGSEVLERMQINPEEDYAANEDSIGR